MVALAVARLFIGVVEGARFAWPGGDVLDAVLRVFARDWLSGPDTVLTIRLGSVISAIVAGAALSTSGVALQNLLRNPLAEPFILGLSSGAGVGYIAQTMLSKALGTALGPLHVGALAGGVATLAIVYLAGRRRGIVDPLGMLLTGVVVTTFNGAIIMVLYHFNTAGDMAQLAKWMQGYLQDRVDSAEMIAITAFTFAGLALLLRNARAMDVAMFSDAEAISMGVNLPTLRRLQFLVAAVLASGAVVLTGPLAFVGLIAPHLARLMLGPTHRNLLIAAALIGAGLILTADVITAALNWRQFPAGVFTAIIGVPVFLSMLRPRLGRGDV